MFRLIGGCVHNLRQGSDCGKTKSSVRTRRQFHHHHSFVCRICFVISLRSVYIYDNEALHKFSLVECYGEHGDARFIWRMKTSSILLWSGENFVFIKCKTISMLFSYYYNYQQQSSSINKMRVFVHTLNRFEEHTSRQTASCTLTSSASGWPQLDLIYYQNNIRRIWIK